MDDEESLLPLDELVRWSRGELTEDWYHLRIAMLLRRAERLAAEIDALRKSDPEQYARLNQPL